MDERNLVFNNLTYFPTLKPKKGPTLNQLVTHPFRQGRITSETRVPCVLEYQRDLKVEERNDLPLYPFQNDNLIETRTKLPQKRVRRIHVEQHL